MSTGSLPSGLLDQFGGGHLGPFIDANENLYVVARISTGGDIAVYKSTNGGSTWTEQDGSNRPNPTRGVVVVTGVVDVTASNAGDYLHVATCSAPYTSGMDTLLDVEYHIFHMSSASSGADTWATTSESVATPDMDGVNPTEHVDIAQRTDGDIIVAHPTSVYTTMGTDYVQNGYSRKEGGSWTRDISFSGGVATNLNGPVRCVMSPGGSGDEIHFFGHISSANVYVATLDASNSLGSGTLVQNTGSAGSRPIAWDNGSSVRVAMIIGETSTPHVYAYNQSGSTGELTETDDATIISSAYASGYAFGLAVASDNEVYAIWMASANRDLYYESSPDADDASWGSTTELETSITADSVWATALTRGGDEYIAYLFYDSFDALFYYGELALSTTSSYTETLTTSIVGSTTASESQAYAETLQTSITATTAASETLTFNEPHTSSITATTTAADQLNAAETLATSVVASTTSSDALATSESLSTSIVATTTADDAHTLNEPLTTSIIATTTASDALGTADALTTSIIATTTASDAAGYTESLTTSIVGSTSIVDTLGGGTGFTENLTTSITGTSTASDALGATEPLTTSVIATTTEADTQARSETLTTSIVGSTTVADALGASESLSTSIIATTTVIDTTTPLETLSTAIIATTTAGDTLTSAEALTTSISAVAGRVRFRGFGRADPFVDSYAAAPYAASHDITGDIDGRILLSVADLTPPVSSTEIFTRWTSGQGLQWRFVILSSGVLQLYIHLATASFASADSTAAPTWTAGVPTWLRFTRNATTGAVNFYESDDGDNWTPIGTEVSGTAGALLSTTDELAIIQNDHMETKVYYAELRDGIDGTIVANPDFRDIRQGDWSSPPTNDDHSNAWDFYNGAEWQDNSGDDFLGATEALTTSITSSTTSNDTIGKSESLSTTGVVTTTSGDTLAAAESVSTSIVATTTLVDLLPGQFTESLATSITASSQLVDQLAGAETLATSIIASSTEADSLAYVEGLSTTGIATTTVSEVVSGSEAFTISIIATTTLVDIAPEVLVTNIIATSTIGDTLAAYEALQVPVLASTTVYDREPWGPGISGSTDDQGRYGATTDRGKYGRTTDRGLQGTTRDRGQRGYTE